MKNIQMCSAVLLSGNNYGKVNHLAFPGKLTFRIQRLYLLPPIDEWWGWITLVYIMPVLAR